MMGLIGKKIGMTQVFNKDGLLIPVTVVKIEENRITQIKSLSSDGYCAIQVTTGTKTKRVTKPEAGHYAKHNITVGRGLWEFRVVKNEKFNVGQVINISLFSNFRKVDVTGNSKGKGFSGTVKRWNFSAQDATHGNSLSHLVPGSIGQNQTPGKVFKGKKMAGQLGNKRVTIQNLDIMRIDLERNLLLIKGAVPGTVGNNLIIKPAVKMQGN